MNIWVIYFQQMFKVNNKNELEEEWREMGTEGDVVFTERPLRSW